MSTKKPKVLLSFTLTSRSLEDPMVFDNGANTSKYGMSINKSADKSLEDAFISAFGAEHTYPAESIEREPLVPFTMRDEKYKLDKTSPDYYEKLEIMSQNGIYKDDGFDYTKFLRPIGIDTSAQYVPAIVPGQVNQLQPAKTSAASIIQANNLALSKKGMTRVTKNIFIKDDTVSKTAATMKSIDSELDSIEKDEESITDVFMMTQRQLLLAESSAVQEALNTRQKVIDEQILEALEDEAFIGDEFEDDFFLMANEGGEDDTEGGSMSGSDFDADDLNDDDLSELINGGVTSHTQSLPSIGSKLDPKEMVRRHIMRQMMNAAFAQVNAEYDDTDEESAHSENENDSDGSIKASSSKLLRNRELKYSDILEDLDDDNEDDELGYFESEDEQDRQHNDYLKALDKYNKMGNNLDNPVIQALIQREREIEEVDTEEEEALAYEEKVRQTAVVNRFRVAMQQQIEELDEKLDCESVVSTYSNIYNRPKLIIEQSIKRDKTSQESDTRSVTSTLSIKSIKSSLPPVSRNETAYKPRNKDETIEERRIRKKAVKEENRERRVQKKLIKTIFNEQRLKQNQ